MNTRPVVFVVGCPRSGTTLVQQLLNAHAAVRIGPETHFVHRYWQRRRRYGDLASDEGWGRLVGDVAAIPALADMGLDPRELKVRAAAIERSHAALLALLLDMFGGGAAVTGEKTPNHLLYMPLLQDWIPEARFIHVLRDPRAVARSWRSVPWSTGTTYGDAAIWRHYLTTALRRPPRPGTLLVVRYEELVGSPARELQRICGFLDLEFRQEMLAHHRSGSVGVDVDREPWKRRAAEPVTAAPADRWVRELTPWQVFQVEATTGGVMRRAGYEPRTPGVARLAAGPVFRGLAAARRLPGRLRPGQTP